MVPFANRARRLRLISPHKETLLIPEILALAQDGSTVRFPESSTDVSEKEMLSFQEPSKPTMVTNGFIAKSSGYLPGAKETANSFPDAAPLATAVMAA